jgi:fructose-specific phosphotransferase system IIA component
MEQMTLTQMLRPACVKVPLRGTDKRSIITELVNALDDSKLVSNKNAALEAVFTREQIRSTGIGFGVAIPHGKCEAVKESVMAIGVARQPVDFDSIDGKPASIIILLISPADHTVPHIQALAGINRLMLDETLRNKIQKTNYAEEIWGLLKNIPLNG